MVSCRKAVLAVVTSLLTLNATNVTVYNNIGAAVIDYDYVGTVDPDCPCYASFSTGAAGSLTDVKLELQLEGTLGDVKSAVSKHHRKTAATRQRPHAVTVKPFAAPGTASVDLYADNSGEPGSLIGHIGDITDGELTSSPATYDFPLGTPIALNASTRYWVGVTTASTSEAAWDWTAVGSGPGVAGEYWWDEGGPAFSNAGEPFIMQVNVDTSGSSSGPTPTPAPGTLVLMLTAAGIGGFYLMRRRRAARA